MTGIRHRLATSVAAACLLALGAGIAAGVARTDAAAPAPSTPVALYGDPAGLGDCTDSSPTQGNTGGTEGKVCQGAGLAFVGPSVGQVANVVGPTIIGSQNVNTTSSNGAGAG
jgi:hypothetical protein